MPALSPTGTGIGDGPGVRSLLFWRWMRPFVMPRTESTMTASMPSATWYCVWVVVRFCSIGRSVQGTYVDVDAVVVQDAVGYADKT